MRLGWWLLLLAPSLGLGQGIREIDVRVPCDAAGPDGLAVRLAVPTAARHPAGAPIAVHVPGGWGTGELGRVMAPLAPLGFIEVRFLFPGPGRGPHTSGGQDDLRGPGCLRAVADVCRYAGGALKDKDGRTLAERIAPIIPAPEAVGLIGWSNGGNQAALALNRHGRQLQAVRWLLTWESPLGEGAATALAGDRRSGPNPAWDQNTGTCDYSRLRYAPGLSVMLFGGRLAAPGSFYLDLNGNGAPDGRDVTPAALPLPPVGGQVRFAYPLSLLRAAAQRQLAQPWPAHLLDAGAAEEFWRDRDAAGQLVQVRIHRGDLLAMVLGTEEDHVQTSPDHPHIWAAYQGWREAKLPFVRLNPDRAYLAALIGAGPAALAPETPAGEELSRLGLPARLVPEGLLPDALLAAAGACELADRTATANLTPDLEQVLFPTSLPRRP